MYPAPAGCAGRRAATNRAAATFRDSDDDDDDERDEDRAASEVAAAPHSCTASARAFRPDSYPPTQMRTRSVWGCGWSMVAAMLSSAVGGVGPISFVATRRFLRGMRAYVRQLQANNDARGMTWP